MRRVIEGKNFDTSTAREVCENSNWLSEDDFGHLSEKLYLTIKGRWFIHYKGGASTEYARRIGENRYSAEGIKLVTEAEAQRFIEKYCAPEIYDRFFCAEEG